jgi:hypothetical protein
LICFGFWFWKKTGWCWRWWCSWKA